MSISTWGATDRHGAAPRSATRRPVGAKAIVIGEHAVLYGAAIAGVHIGAVGTLATVGTESELGPPSDETVRIGVDASDEPIAVVARSTLDAIGRGEMSAGSHIEVRSTVPMGRGLGSSASVFVAVVDAVLDHCGVARGTAERIRLAQVGERIAHGTSSGFDVECVARGDGMYGGTGKVRRRIGHPEDWVFVIGDSGTFGSTRAAIAKVADLMRHSESHRREMRRIRAAADDAVADLESSSPSMAAVGSAMLECHQRLARFDISTPALDRMVESAAASGAAGAKLSGAGLGGCVIALARTDRTSAVEQALRGCGAEHVWTVTASEVAA
ncbi:mevalonate kinase [Nocardia arizonensis]|uniref:mevalonate kinase n=1 Tax=Nocardia arizonensis TaxID=1141647 RepID=UPI0006D1C8B4|nr:mevalonate kinase [Nocardia arizonensis]